MKISVTLFRAEFKDFTVKAVIRLGKEEVVGGEINLPRPSMKHISLQVRFSVESFIYLHKVYATAFWFRTGRNSIKFDSN